MAVLDNVAPGRSAIRAFGAAVLGAGVWAVAAGPLGVTVGLIVVAAFAGWLIGTAARGSDASRRRRTRAGAAVDDGSSGRADADARRLRVVRTVAVSAAVFGWLLALVAVYLYSLAAIPGLPGGAAASTDLAERIRQTSIVAFYAQSFGLLDVLEGAILIATAWWAAR